MTAVQPFLPIMADAGPLAVVSMSGGVDSTATAIKAVQRMGSANCRFVMADTGHEHELTVDYATKYLPQALGITIDVVRADFSADISRKRRFIAAHWADHLVRGKPGKWVAVGDGTQEKPEAPTDVYIGHKVDGWVWSPARRPELANIAMRWPQHIDRIREWEKLVGLASKRGFSSLLHHSDGEGGDAEFAFAASNIDSMVEWAKTSWGGRQYDLLKTLPAAECSSRYGLCE